MAIKVSVKSSAGVNVNSGAQNYLAAFPTVFDSSKNLGFFKDSLFNSSQYGVAETKEDSTNTFTGGSALLAEGSLSYDINVHVVTGQLDRLTLGQELDGVSGNVYLTHNEMSVEKPAVVFDNLGLDSKDGDDVSDILYGVMTGDEAGLVGYLKTQSMVFTGGAGADTFVSYDHNDKLVGGGGDDILSSGSGNDTLDGGKGADRLTGGGDNDTYLIDNKGDKVVEATKAGSDLVKTSITYALTSNVENLTLTGSASINGTGNTLANTITGNSGKNILHGGSGADHLIGGKGLDKLYGEAGSDTFVFHTGDSGKTHATADTIYDFTSSDHIDLTGWDANSKESGAQDFDFIGTKAFSGHVGELHYVKAASDTWIEGDTNGDKRVDFVLHLDDAFTLKVTHFDL